MAATARCSEGGVRAVVGKERQMETGAVTRVSDLQFAAYLTACGYKPEVVGPAGDKIFIFIGVPASVRAEYVTGTVNAKELFDAYFHLKRLLHN